MKKIGILLLLLTGGIAAAVYHFWQQATQLPDWYSKNQINAPSPKDIEQTNQKIEQQIQAQLQNMPTQQPSQAPAPQPNQTAAQQLSQTPSQKLTATLPTPKLSPAQTQKLSEASPTLKPNQIPTQQPSAAPALKPSQISAQQPKKSASSEVQVQLTQEELNDLLVSRITEQSGGKPLPQSVKGFRTSIQDNTLKTGAVIDIKELQTSNIGSQEKDLLARVTQNFPTLGDRKVYIGIVGKPRIQNGRLLFDESTRLQLGNLSMTIAEAAQQLGMPPKQLIDRMNLELQLGRLQIQNLELQNGNAIVRGSAKEKR